jgi:glycine/D-amino acid oxidase-like deaminating enzyme
MTEPRLIIGQGLAGTLLAWACEQAGLAFELVDAGHADAASRVGAGLITPVTGRRWVKTWQIEAWREPALAVYRDLEHAWGGRWVRPMRVWRRFRDDAERSFVEAKARAGALAPYVRDVRPDGAWIDGAVQVDTAGLIAAGRARWREAGWLRETRIEPAQARADGRTVILCGGSAAGSAFAYVPWETAWGEVIEVDAGPLAPDELLHAGHWLLPGETGRARAGATYERGPYDGRRGLSSGARETLSASAALWLGRRPEVTAQDGGWRMTTPDRRPCVGWHRDDADLGLLGGLGSKGTLWAPLLARQWVDHLVTGAAFEPAADVARFARTAGR